MKQKQYKLFRLVTAVTGEEQKEAEKYIRKFSQGVHNDHLNLFRCIRKLRQDDKERKNAKEKLFKCVFSKRAYNDGKMRKLMTELTQLLEDFLVQKELSDGIFKEKILSASLYYRNDYQLFFETVKKRLEGLEKRKQKGLSYFKEKQELLFSIYYHPETAKFTTKNDYFQQAAFCQQCHFVFSSFITGAEGLTRNRVFQTANSFAFLAPALEVANEMGENCPMVILFFKNLVEQLKGQNERPDLKNLNRQLASTFDIMEPDEQRMALKLLIILATPFSNKGDKEFTRFIFGTYQLGIDHDLFRHGNNPISTDLFINIAIAGASVGELTWTKNFIKKYYDELPSEDSHSAFNLCMAAWCYKKGRDENKIDVLKKAMSFINLIPIRSEDKFELRARSLSLRIIFDLFIMGQITFDEVLENARNFERHLKNNSTHSAHKINGYLAFIHHCRQLAKLHNELDNNDEAIKSFLDALQSDQTCVIKQWLLEKAEEVLPSSAQIK